jgi:hypothetical protein
MSSKQAAYSACCEWLREDRGVSGGNGCDRRGSGAHHASPDDENEEVVVVATLKWQ